MRATTSVGPPAANGTMMRTARFGHASAHARVATMLGASKADDVAVALNRRRVIIAISPTAKTRWLPRAQQHRSAVEPLQTKCSVPGKGNGASVIIRVIFILSS